MTDGKANAPVEITLRAVESYEDIFSEVEVDVLFTSPDGESWRVPAFWAGGDEFRVRFAAPRPGRYSFESVCSDIGDSGLHGQAGEVEIAPDGGDCELRRRGRLRAAESRRTLEHVDGTPFFWLADTWWMGLASRLPWPEGFQRLTADRVDKGFNVIQIVVGPYPDFDTADDSRHPQQANEGGWSWDENWQRINPPYYDAADRRIAHLIESGLVPCIVGMWGFWLPEMGLDRVKQHWRNLVARYGALPVVWCLAGEVNMPAYRIKDRQGEEAKAAQAQQEIGWTEVGRYVRAIDPFHNIITAHPSRPDSRAMLRDESCLDLNILQTGHGSYQSLEPTLKMMAECRAKTPPMPTLNSEVCYEGIMGGSHQDVQRYCFWGCVTGGAAGHTYGAQGIWAMSSRDEPFAGATSSWGDVCWQDAMHLAGSTHVGIGRRFLERYPWPLFEPRREPSSEEMGRVSSLACGIPGALAIFYLPCGCVPAPLCGVAGGTVRVEPGAAYTAFYFNPRTGAEVRDYEVRGHHRVQLGAVTPGPDGAWPVPPKPSMEDWVLALEDRDALARLA